MSTKKFIAKANKIAGYYQHFPIFDESGNAYTPRYSSGEYSVGDKAFLGKRINNHHGEFAQWELWEITVEKASKYNLPKVWYGKGRYIFKKI